MYSRKAETIYTTNLKNSKKLSRKAEIVMNDTELDIPAYGCFGRQYVNINGVTMPTM